MDIQWFDRETLERIIEGQIEQVDVVLDIGCGIRPQTFFRPKLHLLCDPSSEYVQILQNRFINQTRYAFLRGSWEEVLRVLPNQCVDSVFLLDVIEHLEKEQGVRLIHECERVARKQIILFTPLGFMPQGDGGDHYDGWGLQGTKWQMHRSAWTPEDLGPSWKILGSKAYHHVNGRGVKLALPQGAFYAIKTIRQNTVASLPVKIAVLSHILPPSPSGQSAMLYRLLKEIHPGAYCLVSRENYDPFLALQNSTSRLPSKYFHLPPEKRLPWPKSKWVRQIGHGINMLLQLAQRSLRLRQILKQEKCGAILACSGDLIDFPAGYLASRLNRVPFYAYLFDDYTFQWPHPFYRGFARKVEAKVLRNAAGVVVPNEFLHNEIQRRHGIRCRLIRNACEANQTRQRDIAWPYQEGEINITYTGAIYHAHYDAFRNLMAAIHQSRRQDVRLHLYTAQQPADMERQNISGFVVYHPHLSSTQVTEVQQQADILFLPLAFDSPIPEVIKTSAPGKMGEYLSSGRPILVHAPSDTYLSWYFKQYDCGLVVDRDDPMILRSAIEQIIDDRVLRERLCENALLRARTDFDIEVARSEFIKLFHNDKRK